MPKNAVTDWSQNADSNLDVAGINIAENCPPAGINNAIRSMMAQIAAFVTGGLFPGPLTAPGPISAASSGLGSVSLATLPDGRSGIVSFLNPSGVRQGYIGAVTSGSMVNYASDNGAGHLFTGGPMLSVNSLTVGYGSNGGATLLPGTSSTPGALSLFDASKTQQGYVGIESGNRMLYAANGGGHDFSGGDAIFRNAVFFRGDLNFFITINAQGNPIINFKNNCYLIYDRNSDHLILTINGTNVASFDGGGNLTLRGGVFPNGSPG